MNQPLEQLRKEAQALKLSTTEKMALHAALMQAMQKPGDASAPRLTRSPFFFAPQFAGAFAALVLVLVGGTAYAAKGSVPGDFLYAIKTNVNEPVEGALSLSVESKIKFHSEVAQARLEEAEVLASQNRLDASTTEKLESDIDAHLSKRDELAQALDEKNPGASVAIVGEFNSSIAAHGDVLAVLGGESKSTTTRDNSDSLASRARFVSGARSAGASLMMAKAAAPMAPAEQAPKPTATIMSFGAAEDATIASDTEASTTDEGDQRHDGERADSQRSDEQPQDEKAALALEKRATSSLESLKRSADATRGKVKSSVSAKLDARLAKISSLVVEGEAALKAQDFTAAKDAFSQALDKSVTLSTFIGAYVRFDNGILGSLLDNNPEGGDDGE